MNKILSMITCSILLAPSTSIAANPYEDYNSYTSAGRENEELEAECREHLGISMEAKPAAAILYNIRRCIRQKEAAKERETFRERVDLRINNRREGNERLSTRLNALYNSDRATRVLRRTLTTKTRQAKRTSLNLRDTIRQARTVRRQTLKKAEEGISARVEASRNSSAMLRIACKGLAREERIDCILEQVKSLNE